MTNNAQVELQKFGRILPWLALIVILVGGTLPQPLSGSPDSDPRFGGSRWGASYFPNVELTTHRDRPG